MFKKLFDKSRPEGNDSPRETRSDTTFLTIEKAGSILIARVKPETVSEREAKIITDELIPALDGTSHRLVVDLSRVEILTSPGIGALVQLHKVTASKAGAFAVFGLSNDLAGLMKLTRMDRLFAIAATEDQAIDAVKK